MGSREQNVEQCSAPRRFKPYPAYKDSGVEWLGDIPEGWKVRPLKRRFRVVNGSTPAGGEAAYWDGNIPWVTPEDLGDLTGHVIHATRRSITEAGYRSCGTTVVPAGSLVLSTRAPIGHLAIAGVALCTNQGCRSLAFRGPSSREYWFYQLLAARKELQSLGQGSTFRELSSSNLGTVSLTEPPQLEQRAIATFLDQETARIDALVTKKERLIELLQEKRAALITRAVTKGLDPNVPMKDSGVDWLGEIPAYWDLWRLRHVSGGLTVGVVVNPSQFVSPTGVPFLRGVDVAEGRILLEDVQFISEEANQQHRKSILQEGDLVSIRVGYPGVTAVIPRELAGSNCASLLITRRSSRISSQLLCYLMNSAMGKAQFSLLQDGAAQEQINVSEAVNFLVPLPPKNEQARIVQELDRETAKIDALAKRIRDAIDRLKELRIALISAAVTGKIDVREEVP